MAKLESNVSIIVDKGERKYEFKMSQGTPCGEAYDACFDVLKKILEMSKEIAEKAQQSRQDAQEASQEKEQENN